MGNKIFKFISSQAIRHPWHLIGLAAIWLVFCIWFGLDVDKRLTLNPGWAAPESGSENAAQILRQDMHRDEAPVIVMFSLKQHESALKAESPEFRHAAEEVLNRLSKLPEVAGQHSYYNVADPRLMSSDGYKTYAIVKLRRGNDEGVSSFRAMRAAIKSEVLDIKLGGELAVYVDVREQLDVDLKKAESVSFLLLAILLLWVFRSFVAALLPLIVGGVTIASSVAWIKAATLLTDISIYAPNVVSMLGLGLSVDYSLFMVSRFREELANGHERKMALETTMRTAGRTLMFSGLTVAASLLCLYILPQRFFHNMALAGSMSVAMAMLTSLLLLPAMLYLLGERINSKKQSRMAMPLSDIHDNRWYRFSHFVMHRARAVLLGSLAILLVLAWPVKDMKIGPSDSRSLPVDAESRQVQEVLERDFVANDLSPVLVVTKTKDQLTGPESLEALSALYTRIGQIDGVAKVEGLLNLDPQLGLQDYQTLYQHGGQFPQAVIALEEFSRAQTAVAYVYLNQKPTSETSLKLIEKIRGLPLPEEIEEMQIGGLSAFHLDYLQALQKDVPKVLAAIVAIIFLLLFLMLGSLLVPLKVVLTNLLSLSATYGILVWVIQEGNLSAWLNFTPQGALDGTVLVLVFASAFGLSIDYEVFLLSRVKEMCDATKGDSFTSVSTGMRQSGPIITNAALLIGVVLGAFALGKVVFIKAIGLGLLLSVIVDATLVRMLLVPSTLRLMGWLNWWAPRPLMRVYQRLNLGEQYTTGVTQPRAVEGRE